MILDLKQIKSFWYGGIKTGRKEKFINNMKNIDIYPEWVETFISNDKKNANRMGCGKSHVNALKKTLEINSPCLILEDDVNHTEWYKNYIEIPDDADAIYLGTCLNGLHPNWKKRHPNEACCSDPKAIEKLDNFYRISGMLTTHAILYISRKYIKDCIKIIEKDNGKNHCDVLMASRMHKYKIYACKYPMFFQDCKEENIDAYEKTITPLWTIFK
jgi:GR25 family glycosyltransferase involved in LPS biosynthesis